MYYTIEPEVVIANILKNNRQRYVTIKRLNEISLRIQKEIPEIYIDLNFYSLITAIENNSEIFTLNNNRIQRAEKSDKYFFTSYINRNFNNTIPHHYKTQLVKFIECNA